MGFVPQSEKFEDRAMIGENINSYKIIREGDFAYNPARINVGSIARYQEEYPCMISSLYVCFKSDKQLVNSDLLLHILKSPRLIDKYKLHGEGGVRIYLFYPNFAQIKIWLPRLTEQSKIAKLLTLIEERITTQIRTIEKLQSLISGITQRVSKHSLIKMTLLSELLVERKEKNTALFPVHSVSVSEGVVNQIDYLGRSFAAADTSHYNVAHKGDIIYTKSPTGEFPFGIVKRNSIESNVAVSPLYGVYQPISDDVAIYLHYYFCSPLNAQNYLHKLIQKGAKNTINITNQRFLENHIPLPDKKTLARFVKFTSAVSTKLRLEKSLLEALQRQKRYLLTSMFI